MVKDKYLHMNDYQVILRCKHFISDGHEYPNLLLLINLLLVLLSLSSIVERN